MGNGHAALACDFISGPGDGAVRFRSLRDELSKLHKNQNRDSDRLVAGIWAESARVYAAMGHQAIQRFYGTWHDENARPHRIVLDAQLPDDASESDLFAARVGMWGMIAVTVTTVSTGQRGVPLLNLGVERWRDRAELDGEVLATLARWAEEAIPAERKTVTSVKSETPTKDLKEWAGGERATLAIVFTDVVGSTALGQLIKDEAMNEVRRAHFTQGHNAIALYKGFVIKTIGDSFMAVFRCAESALDCVLTLQENTGHPQVRIRAGVHVGSMQVEESDVFGATVDFAARVVQAIKDAEIWLSNRAKEDVDQSGAKRHKHLKWAQHENVAMKGFPGEFTLWSLQKGEEQK